ncbi:hypothetical protein GCM10020260_10020 [Nesterenkonia halobia]|uniref:Uncharacterized protein n=1 Tax=Nesterenkonia halobia TaxID=37922 RepID=A0ABP6RHX8_9MICC
MITASARAAALSKRAGIDPGQNSSDGPSVKAPGAADGIDISFPPVGRSPGDGPGRGAWPQATPGRRRPPSRSAGAARLTITALTGTWWATRSPRLPAQAPAD